MIRDPVLNGIQLNLEQWAPNGWCREYVQDGEVRPDGTGYAGDFYETKTIIKCPSEGSSESRSDFEIAEASSEVAADYIASLPSTVKQLLEEVKRLRSEMSSALCMLTEGPDVLPPGESVKYAKEILSNALSKD
jgi:hypothetical protein